MHISVQSGKRVRRSPVHSLPPHAAAAKLGTCGRSKLLALLGASASIAAATVLPATASAAVIHRVANACDVSIVPPGEAAAATDVEAAAGDTVLLIDDSTCNPVAGPVFDRKTQTTVVSLVSGDGITVAAPGVTLDLNGRFIKSSKDIFGEQAALGNDVENAGVTVTAPGVTVTNTNATVALVDNFTADFDYAKGSDGSKLQGGLVGGVRANNIKGGSAHGGGVLAIDRTQKLLIDSVTLIDLAADPAATLGDNGIDWKRCTGPTGTLSNSVIQAPLTGMRVRGCTSGGLTVSNNSLNSPGGAGIEFTRDVKGATVTRNTISNNLADGVAVRAANEAISITGNTIQNNGGCGILTAATAKNITTLPNAFLNNAGGDVCIK